MTSAITPEPWMSDALCAQVDGDLWFPERGESPREAKRLCRTRCPVREQCLRYSLAHHETHGIWGGLSERERRPLYAAQKEAA